MVLGVALVAAMARGCRCAGTVRWLSLEALMAGCVRWRGIGLTSSS